MVVDFEIQNQKKGSG